MTDQLDQLVLDSNNVVSPDADLRSHALLNVIGKRSKKWGNSKADDLIAKTRDEYMVVQKYRELVSASNEKITKKFNARFERELERLKNEKPRGTKTLVIPPLHEGNVNTLKPQKQKKRFFSFFRKNKCAK